METLNIKDKSGLKTLGHWCVGVYKYRTWCTKILGVSESWYKQLSWWPICYLLQSLIDSRNILTSLRVKTAQIEQHYEVNMAYNRITGTWVIFFTNKEEGFLSIIHFVLFVICCRTMKQLKAIYQKSTELTLLIYLWKNVSQSVQSQAPLLGQLATWEEEKLLQWVACQLKQKKKKKKKNRRKFRLTLWMTWY